MNAQFYAGQGSRLEMRFGEPLRVAGHGGELWVRSGAVWLTRRGDPDDVVLYAGQQLRLRDDDDAVFEQWQRDQPAVIDWRPAAQTGAARRRLRATAAAALGALAGGLRRAEAGFAALARSAAASASRAQGCISGGASIASAGTAK